MTFFRIFTIVLIPLVQVVILLVSARFEHYFYTGAALAFLVTDILLVPLFSGNKKKVSVYVYSFPPLGAVVGTYALFFFLEDSWTKLALISVNALVQGVYFLNLYYLLFKPDRTQERSFLHVNSMMHALILFTASGVAYGLSQYLALPVWYWILPYTLIIAGCQTQVFAVHGLALKEYRNEFILATVCIVELAWALSLLPSLSLTNAILLTALASVLTSIIISSIKKELSRMEAIGAVLIVFAVVLFVSGTAAWR